MVEGGDDVVEIAHGICEKSHLRWNLGPSSLMDREEGKKEGMVEERLLELSSDIDIYVG